MKRKREAEEEDIKEAGRRMLEEAQKRAAAASAATTSTTTPSTSNGSSSNATSQPNITPLDLTLSLLIPTSSPLASSSSTLQSAITAKYGTINHIILRDPPPLEPGKKKRKPAKAIVEFEKGNWGGCWACWVDHAEDKQRSGSTGLGEGVRVKWAKGEVPDWVQWAEKQSKAEIDPNPGIQDSVRKEASVPAPAFGSAPDIGFNAGSGTTMEALLAQHARGREEERKSKAAREEFESMTLLKMRRMERERLEAEIRRQEEQEERMAS
jgi:DnaJ family protein C protein 17